MFMPVSSRIQASLYRKKLLSTAQPHTARWQAVNETHQEALFHDGFGIVGVVKRR